MGWSKTWRVLQLIRRINDHQIELKSLITLEESSQLVESQKHAVHHDPAITNPPPQPVVRKRQSSLLLQQMTDGKQVRNLVAENAKGVKNVQRR